LPVCLERGARFDTLRSHGYPNGDMARQNSNSDSDPDSLSSAHKDRNQPVLELLASRPPVSHEEAIAQARCLRQKRTQKLADQLEKLTEHIRAHCGSDAAHPLTKESDLTGADQRMDSEAVRREILALACGEGSVPSRELLWHGIEREWFRTVRHANAATNLMEGRAGSNPPHLFIQEILLQLFTGYLREEAAREPNA
jgi:hypothetical protein